MTMDRKGSMLFARTMMCVAGLCFGFGASAQVVINEVLENPPGSGSVEDSGEFIELHGKPGMDLTGYAIALIKGGRDANNDNIPEIAPEMDEAFSLDGITMPESGFLLLVSTNAAEFSYFGTNFGTPNPSYNPGFADSVTNRRWLDAISFFAIHIPAPDTSGNLANDDSSSYVLVRKRPFHSLNASGQSVYAPGYAWRKETLPDVNFDGALDYDLPFEGASARRLQPYQMVDDVAWSNGGGKEYVRSSQQEISDTPGFNPDAISRLNYFAENPMRGHKTRDVGSGFEILPTRTADESWVYGELVTLASLAYDATLDAEGFISVKAPTDLNAMPFDGSCDPEPDEVAPDGSCAPNPAGEFFFTDLNVAGFTLTPLAYNDHPTDSGITQFRFVRGDFDFNGVVDQADLALIQSRLGATLDDTEVRLVDPGTPGNPNDDVEITDWKWQGGQFQQMLMMRDMDETDGDEGENADEVTQSDVDAVAAIVPIVCEGDTNGDNVVNFTDLNAVLASFGQSGVGISGDVTGDGVVNFSDLNLILSNFGAMCE
jgi:hypothetical protein